MKNESVSSLLDLPRIRSVASTPDEKRLVLLKVSEKGESATIFL